MCARRGSRYSCVCVNAFPESRRNRLVFKLLNLAAETLPLRCVEPAAPTQPQVRGHGEPAEGAKFTVHEGFQVLAHHCLLPGFPRAFRAEV